MAAANEASFPSRPQKMKEMTSSFWFHLYSPLVFSSHLKTFELLSTPSIYFFPPPSPLPAFILFPIYSPRSISLFLTFILQRSAGLLCNYSPLVAEPDIFLAWCNCSSVSGLCEDLQHQYLLADERLRRFRRGDQSLDWELQKKEGIRISVVFNQADWSFRHFWFSNLISWLKLLKVGERYKTNI